MLNSVTEDMARYTAWQQGEPDETAASPTAWLERLESSYTMEEMRSSHHNTVAVERTAAVEFF
jgi:methyl-accepting chemotaxis protein